MTEPLETSELLAFAKTVEARSLSRAAIELSVPRATVSRRLARLEERLGVRLLRRTTRSLALTDAGDALYRHARIVLDAVAHAEASVQQRGDVLRGDLRVSVPPLTSASFYAMVCDFAERHPGVRVHVHFSTLHVDLRRQGYDVAIRAGVVNEPGLVTRTLQRTRLIAVASPSYVDTHPPLRHARDLKRHRCLLGFARGELPQTHWPLADGSSLHVEGALISNDIGLLCDAAVRGLGIAMLPNNAVSEFMEVGQLVQVLPGVLETETRVSIVYPERDFVPTQVRAFVADCLAWVKRSDALAPPYRAEKPRRAAKKPPRARASAPERREVRQKRTRRSS